MRTLITLKVLLLLIMVGCKSTRTPEVGPPSTPIVLGQPDPHRQLPSLDLHPYGHKVETGMPILEPEQLIKVHIKGYTSDHSTYIGPHLVVIRVSPGYFVEPDGAYVPIPVAPELIEVPADLSPEVRQKSDVIGDKERERKTDRTGGVRPKAASPPVPSVPAVHSSQPGAGALSPQVREQIEKVRKAFEAQEQQK